MSESVWHEQVCEGLIKYIKGNIKVQNRPVNCQVRKPDEDFKREQYPLISLYNVYSVRDDFRRCYSDTVITKDESAKTLTVEKPCLPYNLFYQIDFWSTMQSQMDSMVYQWLALTDGGRDFNLPVKDTGGNDRSSYCMCTDDLKKADLIEDDGRLFHSFITYRIYVEIDENIQSTQSLITEVGVTTKQEINP